MDVAEIPDQRIDRPLAGRAADQFWNGRNCASMLAPGIWPLAVARRQRRPGSATCRMAASMPMRARPLTRSSAVGGDCGRRRRRRVPRPPAVAAISPGPARASARLLGDRLEQLPIGEVGRRGGGQREILRLVRRHRLELQIVEHARSTQRRNPCRSARAVRAEPAAIPARRRPARRRSPITHLSSTIFSATAASWGM